ncbi:MAG: YggS family pyridoxal phosphate-dependent enzyme [Deltaproteobacteria bacterium]|nr:YggS family pyridoxal phosphate-dependent enzyme [Deltaproteobacteria bacterium]
MGRALVSVTEGLAAVRARIDRAVAAAGREPGSVRLVAVSKRHPVEAIREAHAAGQRVFGESYAQELERKAAALSDLELEWRFIGHLQRNKAKVVVAAGAGVDSIDSPRLATAIHKRASADGVVVGVRIQVNVAGEAQKSGVATDALDALVDHVRGLDGLRLEGLMTIPPDGEPEDARPHFRALAALADRYELPVRSMGMSGDLEVAIAEGATEVRIGTAVFGQRPG